MNPFAIQSGRVATWPDIRGVDISTTKIYTAVRDTGLPNSLQARIPIKSSIKLLSWDRYATGHQHDGWIREMLEFGFPLQFTGSLLKSEQTQNHSSTQMHASHIQRYIDKELAERALLGPFVAHPFHSFNHTNPIMTRPMADPAQRRIIVDLSFPHGSGPNSYVQKNYVFGTLVAHNLPTIDQAHDLDMNISAAVIDIERAYRNFKTDPIDWPLSVIKFKDHFYLDLALPFGARLSSLYVQKIAEFIARALAKMNIHCLIYLDDLFVLTTTTLTPSSPKQCSCSDCWAYLSIIQN